MNPILEKKFEGFSNLSDEECGMILEKYLLEGLESETLLEREMMTKFLVYPYSARESIRKIFNLAVKKNKQIIGNKPVGEWLKKYGMKYDGKERNPNTFFEFVRDDEETKTLSKRDQTKLMRIFRMYDYLLVDPMPGLDDIRMNILKFPMYLDEDNSKMPFDSKTVSESNYVEMNQRKIVSMTIQEALKSYPNLGERDITVNPLKLKYFPNSVRPSIKNWITDFHDNMGAGKHGSVDRGNYLFHSENGKRLTPMERQKLSAILKSLDEQTPISVDPESQSVVFQSNEPVAKSSPAPEKEIARNVAAVEDNYFQIPKSQPTPGGNNYSPNFKSDTISSIQKTENINQDNFKDFSNVDGKMSFSSPQKLPVEQQQPKVQANNPRLDSWIIKPSENSNKLNQQNDEAKTNKNVVDLRN